MINVGLNWLQSELQKLQAENGCEKDSRREMEEVETDLFLGPPELRRNTP